MRLLAFTESGRAAIGLRVGEEVVNLTALGFPSTIEALLRFGDEALQAAARSARDARSRISLHSIQWRPPIASPAKAIAVGLNYADHAAEASFEVPKSPVLFNRFASSWVGHGETLVRPRVSCQFDYEGELVVVIGKGGRYIDEVKALEHVGGYSVFNEGSIRDYQFKSSQFMIGKNFDRSGSFGPELVTPDELPPGAAGLRLRTRLNGQVMQDGNTDHMIFDVAKLVAFCSEPFALEPGDMIISGTPAGVGLSRKPPLFMKAGDICEVEIEGVGLLSNPIADES
jgi:2-keto-4-pentenoate hydratase/2-oxohepta-3-ene-1,7-dioic acid hydratase in catechol pathway